MKRGFLAFYLLPPMSMNGDQEEETVQEVFSPIKVIYPRVFINFAATKIGKLIVSLDPAVVKIHRYMKLYRLTLHSGLQLDSYSVKDVLLSSAIVLFLLLYQLRYLIIMANEPGSTASLSMGDFLSPLGDARNGLFLGFWAALVQALINRAFIVFYGTQKSLSILTDCEKVSLYVYQALSIDQLTEPAIHLEQRLCILFEFCKFITEGVSWAFILFQSFMVLFTASKLNDPHDRAICLAWSITLIPHTFYTATGVLVALISSISGVLYTHYKLDLLMAQLDNLANTKIVANSNNSRMTKQTANRLVKVIKLTQVILQTMNRHSKILSWLLMIYYYFTVLIASSFSYVTLYVRLEADWLRWVLLGPALQIWLLVIIIPLPIAYVATRTNYVYRKLCSIQCRLPLPLEGKLCIQRLIDITGSEEQPLTYYMANNMPFTLGYHGLFIANIFLTIFLMINFLET